MNGRKNKHGLGKGLDALLGQDLTPTPLRETHDITFASKADDKILHLPPERLEPNPYQPRKIFADEDLKALAGSIAQHGIMQPLVVRPAQGGYQLIAGERRLRAAQLAGLIEVPVVVRQATDQQALLLALLENLQRADLNSLEEARAYQRLMEEFNFNHEDIAQGVGKDRSTVVNTLRLLKLPLWLQDDLAGGLLSQGHGRALLALENENLIRSARDKIINQSLSVRATERLVRQMLTPPRPSPQQKEHAAHWQDMTEKLQQKLGTKVEIKRQGKKGQLVLHFFSYDDLERLLDLLRKG
ncbi:MAG: ParB/RepB/Spo0J family partition protein [Desulfarculales bacterium]|nr:ParB/RepB/Spo0J family partition protein [Desulfarculales bacterium]